MKSFKIALCSSEVAPFAKTGGLADVTAALAGYLTAAGHDVRVFVPLYRRIREQQTLRPLGDVQNVPIRFGERELQFSLQTARLPQNDVEVTLVDCPGLFDSEELYASDGNEALRFALLTRAAIESCQWLQWAPDVFHCNDWHTGLLPLYLESRYAWDKLFASTGTVLTIHNIGYQGVFPKDVLGTLGLEDDGRYFYQEDLQAGHVNFLKTGLLYADALTTVSETYAHEIQTAELGAGLEDLLRARSDSLFGIVNGVDYGEWSPERDTLIPHSFSATDLAGKARNKEALSKKMGLPYDSLPLFGIVSRFTGQKGFELLPDILPIFLQRGQMRLIALGSGEPKHEEYFQWLRDAFPDHVAYFKGYNNELSHMIEAGSDVFLMPSRYEPCGLNQMYSLRYGTVPIVRKTGGLADTVEPFDPNTGAGTGFVFEDYTSEALFGAVRDALLVYERPEVWCTLMQNGMAKDYSWERQGRHYEDLYQLVAASASNAARTTD